MKIEARGVTVTGGGCTIVRDASLDLRGGELVGLVGPNGAGKSTLLRALTGVRRFAGEVLLDGQPLASLPPRRRARRIAYLPQDRHVEWAMAVRDVVALGRHPFQRRFAHLSADDHAAIERAMQQLAIAPLADRPATVLSGGELARTLLARALAVEAPLLLADEPVASLDPFHQLQVMEVLRARANAGDGVLAVLHDLSLAARLMDRVIVMHRGEVVADGPPAQVLDADLLGEVFRIRALTGEADGRGWLLPWEPRRAD